MLMISACAGAATARAATIAAGRMRRSDKGNSFWRDGRRARANAPAGISIGNPVRRALGHSSGCRAAYDILSVVNDLRPRNAELEGYVYVPRMLDKARATLAGAPGGYPFGCPLDHTCMARLGITP